jgi:hypothetical protein
MKQKIVYKVEDDFSNGSDKITILNSDPLLTKQQAISFILTYHAELMNKAVELKGTDGYIFDDKTYSVHRDANGTFELEFEWE